MNLPTGNRGKLVAIGLVLMPVLLLFRFAIVPAWSAYQSIGEETLDAQQKILRLKRLAANLPALERQERQLRSANLLTPYLLTANNSAIAAAGIQRRLQDIVNAHQGRVLSTRVLRSTEDGPFERVTVNARLQLSLEGLQSLLYELETATPYLFVEGLSVIARNTRSRRARRGRPTVEKTVLEARFDVYGLKIGALGTERI
jgi:general secretion pathway protein M